MQYHQDKHNHQYDRACTGGSPISGHTVPLELLIKDDFADGVTRPGSDEGGDLSPGASPCLGVGVDLTSNSNVLSQTSCIANKNSVFSFP